MAQRFNNQCIRYQVDPTLLNEGVPVEWLERRNVRVFQPQLTLDDIKGFRATEHLIDSPNKPPRLPKEKRPKRTVKPPEEPLAPCHLISTEPPEIGVSAENYEAIKGGRLIEIPYEVSILAGKKFRITNQKTGSYIFRSLQVIINNRGLFQ